MMPAPLAREVSDEGGHFLREFHNSYPENKMIAFIEDERLATPAEAVDPPEDDEVDEIAEDDDEVDEDEDDEDDEDEDEDDDEE